MRTVEAFRALNVGGTARATVAELAGLVARTFTAQGGAGNLPAAAPSIVHCDPRRTVADNFEEVQTRVPDLSRLNGLGLGRNPWTLADIVSDAVSRHVTLTAEPGRGAPLPAELDLAPTDARLCASRAS